MRRIKYMIKYTVDDILANIIAQTSGYKQDIDKSGLSSSTILEMVEYLTNEVSKLKSIVLELPKDDEVN